jgi:hypothetical protein
VPAAREETLLAAAVPADLVFENFYLSVNCPEPVDEFVGKTAVRLLRVVDKPLK